MRDAVELAGPLRTPLGLAQWKRASSPGKAGTSGFLSVSDSDRRVPAELGQESQESSCLRKGTPLASRGAQGVSGPLLSCVWNLRVFPEMHDGDSAPSCCAFTHWVAFEEVSGPRVLFKSGQGNRGLSACGTTHGASLKFPSEAGFIMRCAGKAGVPSRQRRGIDSPVAIRRGEGAQMKWGWNPRCYPRGKLACGGLLGVA